MTLIKTIAAVAVLLRQVVREVWEVARLFPPADIVWSLIGGVLTGEVLRFLLETFP